jgi:hypothetical protein
MADLVDSNKILLSEDEIIQKAVMNIRSPYSYDQVYKSIAAELEEPGTQFLRQGNTLFIVHYDGDRQGIFRALNADTAYNYLQNSIVFVKAAYTMGYDVLITEFYDPTIANIFEIISKNPPNPDMGYNIKQSTDGWIGTIALGPDRSGEA